MLSEFRVLMGRRNQPLAKAWSIFISSTHTHKQPRNHLPPLFIFLLAILSSLHLVRVRLCYTGLDQRGSALPNMEVTMACEYCLRDHVGCMEENGCRQNEKDEGSFAILPGCWRETRDKAGAQMEMALCEAACSNQVRGRFQLAIKEEAIQRTLQPACSSVAQPLLGYLLWMSALMCCFSITPFSVAHWPLLCGCSLSLNYLCM